MLTLGLHDIARTLLSNAFEVEIALRIDRTDITLFDRLRGSEDRIAISFENEEAALCTRVDTFFTLDQRMDFYGAIPTGRTSTATRGVRGRPDRLRSDVMHSPARIQASASLFQRPPRIISSASDGNSP